jgi:MFS family permease
VSAGPDTADPASPSGPSGPPAADGSATGNATADTATSTAPRRLGPALLRDTVFRRYWSASTVSMVGDQVTTVAVPLTAVLSLHAGAAAMGYLTALEWLPSLLFGMHAGAWADRRGRRRQLMIACDLGRFLLLATVPVCWALGVLTLWQLFAVVFAAGALLTQLLTGPFAIVTDALSFLGSAFFLRRIDPVEPPADEGKGGATEGLRFIARSPVVRASLIGVAVVNFFNLMFFALMMLYAVRVLHVGAGLLGVVLGCGAVGGLLGAALTKAIAARIGVGLAYVAGAFAFTAPLALVPLAPVPAGHGTDWSVVLMLFGSEFLSGFGVMVLDISIGAIFASVIPDTVRSRVSGAFSAINYGTRPLGALLGGLLGTVAGLRPALWVAVIGGVVGAALLVPSPLPRFRLPD